MRIASSPVLAVVLAVAFALLPCGLHAQQQQAEQPAAEQAHVHHMPDAQPQGAEEGEQPAPDTMMQHHQQMMAKMKELDARLEEKIKAMNEATGEKKIEAMAAVLNELAAQRKEMHQHMMSMQGRMCKMMGQMGSGGGMHGMGGCPMMKMRSGKMELPAGLDGKNVVVVIQR